MKFQAVPIAGAPSLAKQHVPRTTRGKTWPILPPTAVGQSVLVLSPTGLHAELSRCASQVAIGLSLSTVAEKTCKFLSWWFEHLANQGDVWELMMAPRKEVQAHFVNLLWREGFHVKAKKTFKVTRRLGNLHEAGHLISTIRELYDAIGDIYPWQNPFERQGWSRDHAVIYRRGVRIEDSGNMFTTGKRMWYPPQNYDTQGMFQRVVDAGLAYNWPISVTLICRVMGESGGRFCDVSPLTYGDWASEQFGCGSAAPNKGSKQERVKRLEWSGITQQMLERATDERHRDYLVEIEAGHRSEAARPNMRQVRELANTQKGWEYLATLPLFPSGRNKPYSRSTFADHWFRPAMEKSNVLIAGSKGWRRPTPHWLRHYHVEERLRAKPEGLSPAESQAYDEEILEDMHYKTNMLPRYGAHEHNRQKAARQRKHAEAIAAGGTSPQEPTSALPPGASLMRRRQAR